MKGVIMLEAYLTNLQAPQIKFKFNCKDCKAAKYFLKECVSNIGVSLKSLSGYEIVCIANQKLDQLFYD